MAITLVPRKTRTRITQQEIEVMCKARRLGLTLQEIVTITGRSLQPVYEKTKHIPHPYRHKGFIDINKQSGLLVDGLRVAAHAAPKKSKQSAKRR